MKVQYVEYSPEPKQYQYTTVAHDMAGWFSPAHKQQSRDI